MAEDKIKQPDENEKTIPEEDSTSPVVDTPLTDAPLTDVSKDNTLHQLVEKHFLEYASYVIKDRAIPDVDDGLKPVQRRILYAMKKVDDGRFNKVAGIIGDTMKYHPHGDASIGDALVVIANKEYFIEKQGNFGNILTGDPAAASRYIECRLTALAKETLFNKDITEFVDSYDGRNEEPVCLPAKIPATLMLGASGIAVGMSTHIFPHNFRELLLAQIAILKNKPFEIMPDFLQGGLMDVSKYDDGRGSIKLRAVIEPDGDKKVVIREIPATTTTESLIKSIEKAALRGKLRISSIMDYTSETVAIEISLSRGVYADEAIRELYAYTDCEVNVSSTLLVICENNPVEMTVSEVLYRNTAHLQVLLKRELEIEAAREEDRFHEKSLARIFIEKRIYKRIEKCETMEKILFEVRTGLEKFRDQLHRDILDSDIEKLLTIHIRRISLFDLNKNQEELDALLKEMEKTAWNLAHLVEYTIAYIQGLLEKYGPMYPRRTQIASFETVNVRDVARKDQKVYHDKINYFVGTKVTASNKSDTPLVCTEFDRLMLLKNDGICKVINVPEKEYVGPTKYLFLADKDQIYSILYREKKEGTWYVKRFQIGAYIVGKEYQIIPENCLIEYLYTNAGVHVELELEKNNRRSYNSIPIEFDSYQMRSREARGFKVTHYPVLSVAVTNRGKSAGTPSEEEDANTNEKNPAGMEEKPETTFVPIQERMAKKLLKRKPETLEKKKKPAPKTADAAPKEQSAEVKKEPQVAEVKKEPQSAEHKKTSLPKPRTLIDENSFFSLE
ncbi:MAG: DNA topoisomerase IV subunit A [Lentisphaeria bacterium]